MGGVVPAVRWKRFAQAIERGLKSTATISARGSRRRITLASTPVPQPATSTRRGSPCPGRPTACIHFNGGSDPPRSEGPSLFAGG